MGMTKRPQIGHVGTSGQEMADDDVSQCIQGVQGKVSGPQVPLRSHGNEIRNSNRACRDSRTWNKIF